MRATVFTVFNVVLAAFGVLTLRFGSWQDALFLGVIVANSAIGIAQEVRAKRALGRLSLLVAPHAMVLRGGHRRRVAVQEVLVGDLLALAPGDQVIADGTLALANGLRLDVDVLAQQLNAIESLASVDTLCIDKTGTLTAAALRVVEVLPAAGVSEQQLRCTLGSAAMRQVRRRATRRSRRSRMRYRLRASSPSRRSHSPARVAGARTSSLAAPSTSGRASGCPLASSPRRCAAGNSKDGACCSSPKARSPCHPSRRSSRRRVSGRWGRSRSLRRCARMRVRRSSS